MQPSLDMCRLTALKLVASALVVLLTGCATLQQRASPSPPATFDRSADEQSCIDWLASLDAAIAETGVGDAEAVRLPDFPHLRMSRFLASFRDELDSQQKWAAWLQRLTQLGAQRRGVEIANLPAAAVTRLAADRTAASSRMRACGELLASADLASPARLAILRSRAMVPDSYSFLQRAVGIYPLAKIPFLSGVRAWQSNTLDAFARMRAAPPQRDRWQDYAIAQIEDTSQHASSNPQSIPRDALGIPLMSAKALDALSQLHAPIFNVETTGAVDKFGRLNAPPHLKNYLQNSPEMPVDITSPAIYVRQDFTRYGKATLLQLTYTLWFPERPADHLLDLLSGRLDGVMVRLTFAPNGEIVLVDSAHACGCYHLFFPVAETIARPAPTTLEEWAFVPDKLPQIEIGQRLRVWLASRTHYLVWLDAAPPSPLARRFSLAANEALLSAGQADVGGAMTTHSLYQPNGLVAGSDRGERFLFWPMGIASAGQMRQWGHHATAFVGRRHFDDAHLIEKYFEIKSLQAK